MQVWVGRRQGGGVFCVESEDEIRSRLLESGDFGCGFLFGTEGGTGEEGQGEGGGERSDWFHGHFTDKREFDEGRRGGLGYV